MSLISPILHQKGKAGLRRLFAGVCACVYEIF